VHLCSRTLEEFSSIKTQGIRFIICANIPCCHDRAPTHHFHGDNQNIWAIIMVCSTTNYNMYVHYFNLWSNTLTNVNRNMFYLELFVKRIPHHTTLKEFSSYFTFLNPLFFLFFKVPHLPPLQTFKIPKPFTFKVYVFMMNNFTKYKKQERTQKNCKFRRKFEFSSSIISFQYIFSCTFVAIVYFSQT